MQRAFSCNDDDYWLTATQFNNSNWKCSKLQHNTAISESGVAVKLKVVALSCHTGQPPPRESLAEDVHFPGVVIGIENSLNNRFLLVQCIRRTICCGIQLVRTIEFTFKIKLNTRLTMRRLRHPTTPAPTGMDPNKLCRLGRQRLRHLGLERRLVVAVELKV